MNLIWGWLKGIFKILSNISFLRKYLYKYAHFSVRFCWAFFSFLLEIEMLNLTYSTLKIVKVLELKKKHNENNNATSVKPFNVWCPKMVRGALEILQHFRTLCIKSFMPEIFIIKKPVHWFVLQINGLVSINS